MNDEILHFKNHGYTKIKKILTNQEIDELSNTIESLSFSKEHTFVDPDMITPKRILELNTYHSDFEDLVDKLKLLADEFLEEDATFFGMHLIYKYPNTTGPIKSHQDNAYFKMKPEKGITFWIPLCDTDDKNGGIYYSQDSPDHTVEHQVYPKFMSYLQGMPIQHLYVADHDENTDVLVTTEKGDALVHNMITIHRTCENITNEKRNVLSVYFYVNGSKSLHV